MKLLFTFKMYQENLASGNFAGLFCNSCKICMLPYQFVCHKCGNKSLKIKNMIRKGVIKTFTVIHVTSNEFETPVIVSLVKTDDNAHVLGNIVDIEPNQVNMKIIGKRVAIYFEKKNINGISPKEIYNPIFKLI